MPKIFKPLAYILTIASCTITGIAYADKDKYYYNEHVQHQSDNTRANFVKLTAGYNYPRSIKGSIRTYQLKSSELDSNSGMLGIGLGRTFFKNFSAELNFQNYQKYKFHTKDFFEHYAKLHTQTLNLNGYYHHSIGSFTPYATLGIGLARNKLYDLRSPDSMIYTRLPSGTKNKLSWNAGLGIDYRICNNAWAVGLGYNYMNFGKFTSGKATSDRKPDVKTSKLATDVFFATLKYDF